MRLLAAIFALLVSVSGSAQALPATTAAGNPTIVVGVIATLSGPGAMVGQDSVDGFTTALKQMGGRFANQEVRLVAVDDRGSPDMAVQVTRRLLEREKVDFVLTAVSQSSMAAIIKQLLDAKIFILNLDAAPPSLLGGDCHPALFELGTPPEAINEAAGLYFATEKVRRLVVVGPDSPATQTAVAGLRRFWNEDLVEILRPRHGAIAFKEEIARIRELAPDAVYSVMTGGMGVAFVRDYATSGLKSEIPLLGAWTVFERSLLPGMGEIGLDILNVGPWSPDLETPHNKRMMTDFELEYGRPVTSWVAQGYDAALLLESAMKATSGRTSDREAVRNGLRRAEFASVRGGFRFDTNHGPSVPVYLRRVAKDAKGRLSLESRGVLIKDWHGAAVPQCPMRWTDETVAAKPGTPGAAGATSPKPPKPPQAPAPAQPPKKPPVAGGH
ncbi:branched-chain amino acid ABC transporter substrate-binding protein [Paramagnetospirillum marisnigri]|uniref:Branched-chain amino acid ABC transporter substrate-binding protein n=1 Tax=Paramagnetospirillum marisnigri TaxID=1285242 RepID=A0A178MP48_9PROT|nr:ABC transporter substrate-binding protein [Paramagnetospirillum marisnigri]OAN49865.1 branched-chain amino acid ABC transporter substrate-binding protein [Paramagnetospirillum marisnigri]